MTQPRLKNMLSWYRFIRIHTIDISFIIPSHMRYIVTDQVYMWMCVCVLENMSNCIMYTFWHAPFCSPPNPNWRHIV